MSKGKMVAAVVDLLRLQEQHIFGTCRHTTVATFAALAVYFYGSYDF